VLVARPEVSLAEAERTRASSPLGIGNVRLISTASSRAATAAIPSPSRWSARACGARISDARGACALPRIDVPLLPFGLIGVDALRRWAPGA
jgi:arsenite/tail-anchored protein-transporting ATPase